MKNPPSFGSAIVTAKFNENQTETEGESEGGKGAQGAGMGRQRAEVHVKISSGAVPEQQGIEASQVV
jgi:hypothetical protein